MISPVRGGWTIFHLSISISLILLNWFLLAIGPFIFVVMVLLPFLIMLNIFIYLLTHKWSKRRLVPQLPSSWKRLRFLWLITLLLIIAAPLYTYMRMEWMLASLTKELAIESSEISREVTMIENFWDLGSPRNIKVLHKLNEDVDSAKTKITQAFSNNSEWEINVADRVFCSTDKVGALVSPRHLIWFNDDEHMSIRIYVTTPSRCL